MTVTADTLAKQYGFLAGPEVPLLRRLAGMLQGPRPMIINIGVGTGTSAFALLEGNPRAEVVSIDNNADWLEAVRLLMEEAGYADRHWSICGDSIEVGREFSAAKDASMVFFDCGRHEYLYLKDEVPAWAAHCQAPWIAAFHDAVREGDHLLSDDPPAVKAFCEVSQYVREFPLFMRDRQWKVTPVAHERLLASFLVGG
jgi:predicted O-methyltransferase YrrM